MDAILAVFRSRPQAYACVEKLKKYGVNASAVSTPTEANVGCGISARFPAAEFARARSVVAAGGWAKAQAAGKLRIEGKEYLIQDGDVIHVRFSV